LDDGHDVDCELKRRDYGTGFVGFLKRDWRDSGEGYDAVKLLGSSGTKSWRI